jgi:hypothetical protein
VIVVPKHHLAGILDGARTTILLPTAPDPAKRHSVKRPGGGRVCWAKIRSVTPVELDHIQMDDCAQARQEGYTTVPEWRDDYCRTHNCAWTGTTAYKVTIERVPERERHNPLPRMPRDPGTVDGQFKPAPEPEAVDPREVERLPASMEAKQRWVRDKLARQRARGKLSPGEEFDRVLADAKAHGIDTGHYERIVAGKTQALDARVDRKKAA